MQDSMRVQVKNTLANLEEHFLHKSLWVLVLKMYLDGPLVHIKAIDKLHRYLYFILVDNHILEVHHVWMRILGKKQTDVTLFQLDFSNHPILVVNKHLLDSYRLLIVLRIFALIHLAKCALANRHPLVVEVTVEPECPYLIGRYLYYLVDFFNHL